MDKIEGCQSCSKIPQCGCYYGDLSVPYNTFCDDCVKEQQRLGNMK